jgi:hypothetical protein
MAQDFKFEGSGKKGGGGNEWRDSYEKIEDERSPTKGVKLITVVAISVKYMK